MSSIVNIHSRVNDWVLAAISKFQQDRGNYEQVLFAVALQAFPDPAREVEHAWIPQLVVYLEMAGPMPGTSVFGTPMFRPYSLTEEAVTGFVIEALTDMVDYREARQQSGNETSGSPQQPVER